MCFDGDNTLQDWMVWAHHPVRKDYDIIQDLGEGAFSQVVLGCHKVSRQYVALKVVFLQNPEVDEEHMAIMLREAEFLRAVDSPHIVKCIDVVDDPQQQVIVLEYLRGGQFLDHLHTIGNKYSEQQAAALFAQMVAGVRDMHAAGLIHRDVKAENFVFAESPAVSESNNRPLRVTLIDLGMAMKYDRDSTVHGALGSPGFVAPEIAHDGVHTPAMDMFSLGVVLFIMLVGRKPFNIGDSANLKYCDMDIKDAPGVKDARWLALSAAAKDLVMGMLRYKPEHRLTSSQALAHPWVSTLGGTIPLPLDSSVVRGAANVAALRRLRTMVHGAVGMRRVADATLSPAQSRKAYLSNLTRTSKSLERSAGYRDDPSARGISKLERITLSLTARNAARAHDAGATMEPTEDISVHYRTGRGLSSSHSSMNDLRKQSMGDFQRSHPKAFVGMRQSASTLVLSELMPADGSSKRGGMVHSSSWGEMGSRGDEQETWASGGGGSREGSSRKGPRPGELMRSLTGSVKGMLGSSGNLKGMLDAFRSESSRHGSSSNEDSSRQDVRKPHTTAPGARVAADGGDVPGWGAQRAQDSSQSGRAVHRFVPLTEGEPLAGSSPSMQPSPTQQPTVKAVAGTQRKESRKRQSAAGVPPTALQQHESMRSR